MFKFINKSKNTINDIYPRLNLGFSSLPKLREEKSSLTSLKPPIFPHSFSLCSKWSKGSKLV